jgi:hypothetical protein
MKNRNGSVRSAQALAPAELLFLFGLLIPGSVALSQPFPSFMLDTTATHVPGSENVGSPRVAFGPDVGLAVWRSEWWVRGALVGLSGSPLDSLQIDIDGVMNGQGTNMSPGVAWGGGRFLVVWADDEAMKYALVAPDGSITTRSVLQDEEWRGSGGLALAFDGTSFLVSWVGGNDTLGRGALFCRVSPDGVVLDRPPRFVAPLAPHEQSGMALCFNRDRYLAAWEDGDPSGGIGVSANFIFPDGSIADSAGFCIRSAGGAGTPAVTHDQDHFLVAWNEWHDPALIRLARVTDSGVVLDTSGVLIDSFSGDPAIVSSGDTTLVAFARDTSEHGDSSTIVAVRIDAALNRLDAAPVRISATSQPGENQGPDEPFVTLCGDDYFVNWDQQVDIWSYRQDYRQVMSRRVSRTGELLDSTPAVLSLGPARQSYPNVASDGENFLGAWPEYRHDSLGRLYYLVQCSRFTADGDRLDPRPIPLGSALYDLAPGVAFGGGCYLVTWQDSSGMWSKRVTPAGVVLDSAPLHMPDMTHAYSCTDAAFGDSFFLVAWIDGNYRLHGCRVTPTGAVLDSTPLLLGGSWYAGFPQVAFDGNNFLVVWRDGGDGGMQRCVRVSQDGVVLDTADITLGPGGGVYYPWNTLDVAFGSGVYFTINNQTGRCCRVSPDGYLIDSVVHPHLPVANVVFDGTDFMLLCQSTDTSGEWLPSLSAMRITPDGRVLDSLPFALVAPDSALPSAHDAAMAINSAGRIAAVFECRERSPYLTQRIRAATFPAIVGIGTQRDVGQPVAFRVQPNPASRLASLSFNLTRAGPVQVTAFDATGRRCASLFSGRMNAGRQTIPLDTRRLTNGVYFLRLEAEAATHSTRLVISH